MFYFCISAKYINSWVSILTLFTTKQQDNQLDIVASMHFKDFFSYLKKKNPEYALMFTEEATEWDL